MALNFPNSPTLNQVYTDSTSGFSYQWNGTVWISFTPSSSSQIKTLDDFSASFNNSTQTFSLTSGGNAVTPPTPQSLIINLGGVIQDPTDDYSVAGSNITFSTPPANGLSFSGVALGPAVPVNTVSDGSVTPVKLSTGGPSWNTAGDVYISGITTVTNTSGTVTIGIGTTALLVEGNARVTGILTVGTSSITLNGTSNIINVGTGVTINGTTGNISATSFSGDGSGLTGAGIGTNGNVNTSGIITATAGNFTTLELGHATDTTLSRSAAGVLAVEGVVIPSVSSTNTLTNKTLTDPAIIGTILEDVFTITDGAAFEIDPGNGSVQLITLGASRTPKATNMVAGESITLMVDDGSAYTLTWSDATFGGTGVVWKTNAGVAPTLNTTGYTVIVLWKVSTQVYGARVGDA